MSYLRELTSTALTEKLHELESKISREKSNCVKEKRAKNMEKAKQIFMAVMAMEKEGIPGEVNPNKASC